MPPRLRDARKLLAHYRRTRRRHPWRAARRPYPVWVAEIMLQQTRVDTVLPYYRRFMRRFPTVRALAEARLDDVLHVWQGLGYYARARNLHRAARVATREGFPRTAAEWSRLPGVGAYTAAAVASICNGERAVAFDANVRRVAVRLAGREAPDREVRRWVQEWIPADAPGEMNQAIMELGQRICRPVRPDCPACPLRADCRWYRSGRRRPLPRPRRRDRGPRVEIGLGIVRRDGRILIGRRPQDGMLGGLWEFPGGKRRGRESLERTARREVLEETGVRVRVVRKLGVVRHAYSHFSVELHAFECVATGGRARPIGCDEVRWIRPADLRRFAFPAANARMTPWIVRGRS